MKLPGSIVNRPKGSDRWSIILEQRDAVTGKRKQKWHSFKGKKKKVGQRTLERYEELLRVHVKPKLGARSLQKLQASEIDGLYNELENKMAPMTMHHVPVTLNS